MTDSRNQAWSEAIRAALRERYPEIQVALTGVLVIEVLEDGEPDPVLRSIEVGNPSMWFKVGALRAAGLVAEDRLRDAWVGDDDE